MIPTAPAKVRSMRGSWKVNMRFSSAKSPKPMFVIVKPNASPATMLASRTPPWVRIR